MRSATFAAASRQRFEADSAAKDRLLKEARNEAFKARDDADSERHCAVCAEKPRDTVLLPCRHACLCAGCARAIMGGARRECPVCRAAALSSIHVLYS